MDQGVGGWRSASSRPRIVLMTNLTYVCYLQIVLSLGDSHAKNFIDAVDDPCCGLSRCSKSRRASAARHARAAVGNTRTRYGWRHPDHTRRRAAGIYFREQERQGARD